MSNAHHGDAAPITPEFADHLRKLMEESGTPLGATQQFPRGKMHPDDEGELRFAVGHKGAKVVVDFGKPVAWLGLDPSDARTLAKYLIEHADACEPTPAGE